MSNEKQEKKEEATPQQPKMREILIQTNGNVASIVKADVAGVLELRAILQGLLDNIK